MQPSASLERFFKFSPASRRACPARVPLLQAAAAQCGALLLLVLLSALIPGAAAQVGNTLALAMVHGCVAALLGRGFGMETWWFPINALFAPGLVGMLGLDLPPYYALGAFCVLASVYWGVSGTRVPLFFSSRSAARAVADLLPREHSFKFIDLGSGLAGMLSCLARARPAGRYHGIEAAPLPFLLGWLRTALSARSCRVSWGDFRNHDLGRYDVVYAYLSPAAMTGLWEQARREMRAGTLLISNSFAVPGVPPAFTMATGGHGGSRLLAWRM